MRFFKPDSIVKDWYRGQLSNALASVNQADVAFVMYYAPWDAESQYVRGEFEKAALVLKDRVSIIDFHLLYVILTSVAYVKASLITCYKTFCIHIGLSKDSACINV